MRVTPIPGTHHTADGLPDTYPATRNGHAALGRTYTIDDHITAITEHARRHISDHDNATTVEAALHAQVVAAMTETSRDVTGDHWHSSANSVRRLAELIEQWGAACNHTWSCGAKTASMVAQLYHHHDQDADMVATRLAITTARVQVYVRAYILATAYVGNATGKETTP